MEELTLSSIEFKALITWLRTSQLLSEWPVQDFTICTFRRLFLFKLIRRDEDSLETSPILFSVWFVSLYECCEALSWALRDCTSGWISVLLGRPTFAFYQVLENIVKTCFLVSICPLCFRSFKHGDQTKKLERHDKMIRPINCLFLEQTLKSLNENAKSKLLSGTRFVHEVYSTIGDNAAWYRSWVRLIPPAIALMTRKWQVATCERHWKQNLTRKVSFFFKNWNPSSLLLNVQNWIL